jgi:glycine dehydrogenase subunit 2
MKTPEKLIFTYSKKGRTAFSLPETKYTANFAGLERKTETGLPEVSEIDVVRHYTRLSQQNYGVDNGFYPLGSCTMKYNPKINEDIAALPEFTELNPNQSAETLQPILKILYDTERYLSGLFGYERFTLQPSAGANGELTGLMIMRAYHLERGDTKRNIVIVPDASHGTNPASCTFAGFKQVTIKSLPNGHIDIEDLKANLNDSVAGLMLTNPSTIGLFEKNILEVSRLVHAAGGLLYYDGANANAIMGIAKPADMGFDICHLNLHKTFATPHGGGGPGSGPVGVVKNLVKYLPVPVIEYDSARDRYSLNNKVPGSIGKVHGFMGNVGVVLKAYVYIRMMGMANLRQASEIAILNANYIRARLMAHYDIVYKEYCQHEFVISAKNLKKEYGITAGDIAKRLQDYGYHPPTIYFPLIVSEGLMIEPTETETKETLDAFCEVMIKIAEEIKTQPELVKGAPYTTIVGRLDEVKAVKEPKLQYFCEK